MCFCKKNRRVDLKTVISAVIILSILLPTFSTRVLAGEISHGTSDETNLLSKLNISKRSEEHLLRVAKLGSGGVALSIRKEEISGKYHVIYESRNSQNNSSGTENEIDLLGRIADVDYSGYVTQEESIDLFHLVEFGEKSHAAILFFGPQNIAAAFGLSKKEFKVKIEDYNHLVERMMLVGIEGFRPLILPSEKKFKFWSGETYISESPKSELRLVGSLRASLSTIPPNRLESKDRFVVVECDTNRCSGAFIGIRQQTGFSVVFRDTAMVEVERFEFPFVLSGFYYLPFQNKEHFPKDYYYRYLEYKGESLNLGKWQIE